MKIKNCLKKVSAFIEGHPKTADWIQNAVYLAATGTALVLVYTHFEKKRTENERECLRESYGLDD